MHVAFTSAAGSAHAQEPGEILGIAIARPLLQTLSPDGLIVLMVAGSAVAAALLLPLLIGGSLSALDRLLRAVGVAVAALLLGSGALLVWMSAGAQRAASLASVGARSLRAWTHGQRRLSHDARTLHERAPR